MSVIGENKEKRDPSEEISSTRGTETKAFLDKAPSIVGELVHQIIECRDVRVRTRLRSGIKSIIDLICIDTIHPSEEPAQKKQISLGGLPGLTNEDI